METLHARYPFLEASRDAVEAADVDLASLVREGGPPVRRARERVRRALLEGTVEAAEPRAWSTSAEVLSYPVARILVSELDVRGAVDKYAAAEAETARERLVRDVEGDLQLKSSGTERLTLSRMLDDFGLLGRVEPAGDDRFHVAVTAYLELSAELDGSRWRLATRPLRDGRVPVERPELHALLREAVRQRVVADLPLSVPDAVAESLADDLAALRGAVEDVDPPLQFDTVVPGLFPPCMRALLGRARSDEQLPDNSRFALVSFLVGVGLDGDEVASLCDLEAAAPSVPDQVARLRGDRTTVATPPSCEVMVEYGDCVNKDQLCETIDHPLSYYDERLDRTSDDRLLDWRD